MIHALVTGKSYYLLMVVAFASFLFLCGQATAQNNGHIPNYTGYLDHAGCDTLAGWAADRNSLNNSITVSIYSDGVLATTTVANQSRPDVGSYLGDNGLHGFSIPTPASIKDGQTHQVRVVFESSMTDPSNSPAVIICTSGPPPLCANHVITTTPTQGASLTTTNLFCRDRDFRTRYDTGRYVTITDPVAQQVILLDTYTSRYGVFTSRSGGTDFDPAVPQDLIIEGAKPPARPPAGCPTGSDGWSVTAPQYNSNTPTPTPTPTPTLTSSSSSSTPTAQRQTLNVWNCPSYALPMYLQIINPSSGTTELEFQSITPGDPDPQYFAVPATYSRDDTFSFLAGYGWSCAVQEMVDPLIVVTSGSHRGQAISTAMTSGSGCPFTDATIYTGRSLTAAPLTSKNNPVFQLSLWDNGTSSNAVDVAQLSLTTIDGAVSNHMVILLRIH